jgi:hypothetical protein
MVHGALGAGTTDDRGEAPLWDFILEVMKIPGLRAAAVLAFLGILFLEKLLMAYSGSMELDISYGGFQFALH